MRREQVKQKLEEIQAMGLVNLQEFRERLAVSEAKPELKEFFMRAISIRSKELTVDIGGAIAETSDISDFF